MKTRADSTLQRNGLEASRQIRTPVNVKGVRRHETSGAGPHGGWRTNPYVEFFMSVTMRQMLEAGVHFGHQTR
ncbi:MAG: hypothetical protein ABI854_01975, partial [Betaproteobacteria bacterium]